MGISIAAYNLLPCFLNHISFDRGRKKKKTQKILYTLPLKDVKDTSCSR